MTTANPVEIAELMYMSVRRMRRLADVELGRHGLSLSRTKILGTLTKNGPQQQSALALACDIAPRTVTELVDLLERDGLVERRTDPADRRARQVHLTPAGREVHARAVTTRSHLIERLFGVLNEEQLLDLAVILRQIDREVAIAMDEPHTGLT
jgi:DNA-binding MarR family transcriptional regulator